MAPGYLQLDIQSPMELRHMGGEEVDPLADSPVDLHSLHDEQEEEKDAMRMMVEGAVQLVARLNFMKVELGEPKSLRSKEQWRSVCAEYIATLIFVFCGCGSVIASDLLTVGLAPARILLIGVAHGLTISFLVASIGAISGGHINPAVTIAFVVAGKETLLRASMYIMAQLLGSVSGAFLLQNTFPPEWQGFLGAHILGVNVTIGQGLLMEIVLSFLLVFVIFGVAVDRRGPGVIAPLPIGFAVLVCHLVGIPITGASMNPARSFGPALVSGMWNDAQWIYWLGPCIGGAMAAALFRYVLLPGTNQDVDELKSLSK